MAPARFQLPESQWRSVEQEAVRHLQHLIRIDTTNPPGNEAEACAYLASILARDKIPFDILESAPGRGNLVCRLRGNGSAPPLLLNAHLDVVAVEPSRWSHDPFGGEIDQGCIWGRGALDMKNMAVMSLVSLLLVHRHKIPLRRDLVFAAVADEEAGGTFGSAWLVREHPEKVRAEICLGEIGGFSREIGGKHFYPVQIAEKGICWFKVKTAGEPGHGSVPVWNGAVARIGRAAQLLGTSGLPFHRTEEGAVFFETLAKHLPFPKAAVLRAVLHPRWSNFVLGHLFPDPSAARGLYALLHNTANPTILRAGEKVNVVPSEASLEVDGRTLPGQTSEDLLREVRQLLGEGYDFEVLFEMPALSGSPTDPVLAFMERALRRWDPEAIVAPTMVPGFTDAKHYSRLGARCFGFSPVRIPENFQFLNLMHGHDERIPVDGFLFGLRVLFDLVVALCANPNG